LISIFSSSNSMSVILIGQYRERNVEFSGGEDTRKKCIICKGIGGKY
jgi:hypothetical protein